MGKTFALLAIGALAAGCASARATSGLLEGPPLDLAADGDLGVDKVDFASGQISTSTGFRVAYEKAPTRGMVAVVLTFDFGSMADPPDREGLAHLVEHLIFRDRPRGADLAIELARVGATYDAETTADRTTFYQLAPRRALPALLDLAAGMVERPLGNVDAAGAAVELDVVRRALADRNESGVYGQLSGWLKEVLFAPQNPSRRPVGGTPETLQRLTLADAREFVRTFYKPERASLLIVSELDGPQLEELVRRRVPELLEGDPPDGPLPHLAMPEAA